ncbi:hypothetical protein BrevBR_08165 [Brevundimonas sp. BR2-1]|uniref:hypothetical protein n=1 Tax=Brevundimonas sp. BR2-1 TaxID=3031123 RepID=UPI00309E2991
MLDGLPSAIMGRMPLSPDEIEEFKKRYEHAFNIKLSDGEALDLADRLEELYRIVLDRSAAPDELPRAPNPPWRTPPPNPEAETHPRE